MESRKELMIEQQKQKEQRKEEVVAAAVVVFKKQGIENTKMTDIAEKAEVGVASVYRYFKSKPDLVVAVACMLWQVEIAELYIYYSNKVFLEKRGIEKVKEILDVFLKLYQNHQDFIGFIYEFDSYVVREKISSQKLEEYEKKILNLESVLVSALESGKVDGTIRTDVNNEQFYFAITHALMSLCQKLVLRGNILESDKYVDGDTQIKIIIDMAVKYIKTEEKK